jgi:DNA-binding LacI/PurR family transcriptional regulator
VAVTLHDVAIRAGVSIKTVSQVVNGHAQVSPSTRQRVLAVVEELGYQPNLSARSLRSGRTHVISLIIPTLRNAYFAELADEVMVAATEYGLSVLIEQVNGTRASELAALHGPRGQGVDGLLYSALELGQADEPVLEGIDLPLVLLGDRMFNTTRDHVTIQNEAGAKAAAEHLLSLGRRRIVALGAHRGEVIGSAGLRLAGYCQALLDASVPGDDQLVRYVGTWHRSDGADAMRALLAEQVPFDAVLAFNDTLALGAMRVLQEAGLRIPDDVAVIGFDDIDETRYSLPTLSTVNPGRTEIARTAVRLLADRIAGRHVGEPLEIEASFRVLPRESTAVAR